MFEAEPGLFYGLSSRGTDKFGASIFMLTSAGAFQLIHSFQPFVQSYTLAQGANGLLYGAGFTSQDFHHFYFSIQTSGKNVQQYSFPGQWGSAWQTIVVSPDELADIVAANPSDGSRVFGYARIGNNGEMTILHEFSGDDRVPAGANLVRGREGIIYGIGTEHSGADTGFIFRLTPGGTSARLVHFPVPRSGRFPLLAASDGNLYGLFSAGGANNTGELYRATPSGIFETAVSFPAKGMVEPQTLMQASDGNIYGSTNNTYIFGYNLKTRKLASVFRLNPDGSQGLCPCQFIQGTDGKLYGVAPFGGKYPGIGALFSLDIGLPRPTPVISQIYPTSGTVGQAVLLWGTYLLGATSVSFNGKPATTISVTSGQSVRVTVPAGATSGLVTIRTANGAFTTKSEFRVVSPGVRDSVSSNK